MDAKQAKRATKSAISKRVRRERQARQDKVEAKKKARRDGRKNYLEHLKKVRKKIREATQKGESFVSVDITGTYIETDEIRDLYYYGVQEKIKSKLESEGYKVEIFQKVDHDEPFGSDPMFDKTMHWLSADVHVSW